MNYLVDLIIIAIIALSTFSGYKKGLLKVAFGFLSFILAIIISIVLYKPVSNFIISYTPIDEYIEEAISENLSSLKVTGTNADTETMFSGFFDIKNISTNIINSSTNLVAENVSKTIINICCMIIVFVIANIILLLFKFIGDLISKLPLLKQVNHIGGFLYGLLKGLVIIYILLALVSILSPIIDLRQLVKMINNSIIANIMYNNNIILVLFG